MCNRLRRRRGSDSTRPWISVYDVVEGSQCRLTLGAHSKLIELVTALFVAGIDCCHIILDGGKAGDVLTELTA